jgi:hypothetical protein
MNVRRFKVVVCDSSELSVSEIVYAADEQSAKNAFLYENAARGLPSPGIVDVSEDVE